MQKNNTILVIVPHGDDEILLCGGTIHKFANLGHEINVAFVRQSHDERTFQQLEATKKVKEYLKIKTVHYLNLTEEETANDFLKLKCKVEEVIDKVRPQTIFTTFYGDNHQDHQNLFRAVSVACRHHNAPYIKQIYVGEVCSSTEQNIGPDKFAPTVYIPLSETNITAKILAMEAYQTERRDHPHARSSENINALATYRGARINTKYAEAFMCMKYVWD
jgi:LmbE family N-acetylglucosaminyl deacetylase